MQDTIFSPVPNNQIPLTEYTELSKSYFFSWPQKSLYTLYRNILLFWFACIPLFLLISTGSYAFKEEPIKLIFISLTWSFIIPLILLLRQYLGWRYILLRLLSDQIIYEESDWHDGQTWRKPMTWIARDALIAKYKVSPVIARINYTLTIFLVLTSIFIVTYFIFNL